MIEAASVSGSIAETVISEVPLTALSNTLTEYMLGSKNGRRSSEF